MRRRKAAGQGGSKGAPKKRFLTPNKFQDRYQSNDTDSF